MGKLFGTDGARGVANSELTPELAMKIGRAAAIVLTKHKKGGERAKIVIGKDTRVSSNMLEAALSAGICSTGSDAYILETVPTPAVAFLVKGYDADAGVMISASHNPVEFNGIKLFDKDGFKLPDSLEDEIEELIFSDYREDPVKIGGDVGQIFRVPSAKDDYIEHIVSSTQTNASGLKVALDLANGSASATAPELFKRLGADIEVIAGDPNGININRDCGSTHIENIAEFVKEGNFDIGLSFDGDADRLLAVDEKGNLVDGDKLIAIFAWYLKEKGELRDDTVVVTVMSNLGFFEFADKYGINALSSKVGDRYVLEKMIEGSYVLGGEQSGHIILLEHASTGDGQLSAAMLLKIMSETGKPLSELARVMETYPQVMKNVTVPNENKAKLETDKDIKRVIGECQEILKKGGRVLVRASGTEPLVRVMLEGKDEKQIDKLASKIADKIREKIGA